jgi:protein O-GlcNAc transferase
MKTTHEHNRPSSQSIMDLADRGQMDEALAAARRLTQQQPQEPAAWRALGYVQARRNSFQEAEQTLLRAISLSPEDALSWEHLGWLYRRIGDFARAITTLRKALELDAGKLRPRMMLANSLADLGKPAEAIAEYRRVLERDPTHVRAHNNLANLLVDRGRLKEAVGHYARAASMSEELTYRISAAYTARRLGDWTLAEEWEPRLLQSLRSGRRPGDRAQPFPLIAMPAATAADQLTAGRQMAQAYVGAEPVHHELPAALDAKPRLRIGYVSSDLYDHATVHLIVEALELHDRDRYEIIGFDYSADHRSGYRNRILRAFDGWTTHARPRILAHRPAPVMAQWLGYPGTMGAPWIDYAIVDSIVAPPASEIEFSEKLVRLPHCYQPNDRGRTIDPAPTRAQTGLPADAFVYCCFNQAFKVTREMFALWLDLLRATPHAVLWLTLDNRWAAAAMREHAQAGGIDPARLIFGRTLRLPAHLARLSLADVALDCAPCGSHTTASDALWAGVPQIAYLGDTFAARVSASLLTAIGLPEMIVRSPADYRDLAVRLASDRAALAQIRTRLVANRLTTPLFDSRRFVRHLEAGYEAMWRRCIAGLAPDHIDVQAIA